MISEKSWDDFRNSGLLWFINTTLHAFGWAIVVKLDEEGNVKEVFPARVKFRGFSEEVNTDGYIKLTEYLAKNSDKLLEESKQ